MVVIAEGGGGVVCRGGAFDGLGEHLAEGVVAVGGAACFGPAVGFGELGEVAALVIVVAGFHPGFVGALGEAVVDGLVAIHNAGAVGVGGLHGLVQFVVFHPSGQASFVKGGFDARAVAFELVHEAAAVRLLQQTAFEVVDFDDFSAAGLG